MYDDIECPYCGKWQEINHDDGYGYDESEQHEQECIECEKVFGYWTSIIYHYEAVKTPCKNGEPHKLIDYAVWPKELGVGKKRCEYCNEIIMVDEKAHKEAAKRYMEELNNNVMKKVKGI